MRGKKVKALKREFLASAAANPYFTDGAGVERTKTWREFKQGTICAYELRSQRQGLTSRLTPTVKP